MPLITPLTSVEMICGTSCLTLDFALDGAGLVDAEIVQPALRPCLRRAEAFCEIESFWEVIPPITSTTTSRRERGEREQDEHGGRGARHVAGEPS